jgi:hypothetical protein
MPRPLEQLGRRINFKIVHITQFSINVYNYTSSAVHQFNTRERMFAYHSPNAVFIDYETSKLISRTATGTMDSRNIFALQDSFVYYIKLDEFNIIHYYKINGDEIPVAACIGVSNSYMITYSRSITNIQDRIMRRPIVGRRDVDEAVNNISDNILGQTEQINENLIYGYHTRMGIIKKDVLEDRRGGNNRYFGIELEIDMERNRQAATTRRKHALATKLNTILNEDKYNSMVKFERDGSLGAEGFEIITQPMTYTYIMKKKAKIIQALKAIDQAGYSSHDSGKCGLHIHVSRTELPARVLDNVFMIFENFKNELIAFSRRNENQMRWSKFITDDYSRTAFSKTEIANMKSSRCNHYCVINNANAATVEFRLFRGTTKPTTFFGAIQLIDNIVTIATQRESIEGLTWEEIINFNPAHTELIAYNNKRNIVSKHIATDNIERAEVNARAVILVRPFQMQMEGDN